MKFFYFPDWKETVDDVKTKFEIISKFGHDVEFISYDMVEKQLSIDDLAYITYSSNGLIIGNAVGAYYGYYVSNIIKAPSLLFNPAFFFKNGGELSSNRGDYKFMDKKIILSSNHDKIDTKRVFKFLRKLGYDNQIKVLDNLTNAISDLDFEVFFAEFQDKYKNYIDNKKKEEKEDSTEDYKVSLKKGTAPNKYWTGGRVQISTNPSANLSRYSEPFTDTIISISPTSVNYDL